MKRILKVGLVVLLLAVACHIEHNYTRTECEITHKNDAILEFTDKCGFTWSWYAETDEDIDLYNSLEMGDKVNLKMYDNLSSAYIEDDVVKKVVKK